MTTDAERAVWGEAFVTLTEMNVRRQLGPELYDALYDEDGNRRRVKPTEDDLYRMNRYIRQREAKAFEDGRMRGRVEVLAEMERGRMTTDSDQEASWERRRKIASGSVDREEGAPDADGWIPIRHVFPERAEVAEDEAE